MLCRRCAAAPDIAASGPCTRVALCARVRMGVEAGSHRSLQLVPLGSAVGKRVELLLHQAV